MAADGSIKIKAELDKTAAEKAMSKFSSVAKAGFKAVTLSMTAIKGTMAGISLYAAKTGIEFESAFTGVRKTVDATENELQGFRNEIRDMSKDIPASAAAISGVAEAAGQLGIQNKNLMSFTRTMTDLGVATNMSAEEAATSMARFANITKMPQEEFSNLGSTVVALGNNLATTEREISEMGLRLAGAGAQVGMSEAQILGLAGALSSVGIEADAGGSAVSTVMAKMQLAVEHGGDALEQFASVAGMSASEFQQAFKEDAAQALVSFVTGLSTMEERGQSAIATLDDMEITEIRQRDALLRLSGAGDVLSKSLGIATQAWDDNNALTNEASQRYETLESRLQVLKNNVDDFAISIYDNMRDPLRDTVNESIDYIQRLHSAFNDGGVNAVVGELGNVFRDVTDDIAGTSDAAAGIVEPLQKIVSVGTTLGGAVLPIISDGFEFAAKNMKTAIPVAVSLTTAYKSLDIIKGVKDNTNSLGKIIKTSKSWWITTSKVISRYAEQMEAAKYTGRMYNVELTVGQAVVGAFTGKVTMATVAQKLWNAAMAANPMTYALAGVVALTAGLAAYTIVTDKSKTKNYELSDSENKLLDSCKKVTDSLNEQRGAREESVQSVDMEYDGYQSLLSELQAITDENGRVKAGYEERAKVITGQLSDALGTEIVLTDGVIQNYQETVDAIKGVIVQKKAEALCTALQEEMAVAYKNSQEALLAYKDAVAVAEQKQKDLEEAQTNYNKVTEMYAGNNGPKAISAIREAERAVEDAEEAFDKASESVDSTRTSLNELSAEVNNYDSLVAAMQTGTTAEIESAMNSLLSGYQSYTAEMLATSQTAKDEMLEQAKETTGALSVLVNEGGQMYQAFGEDSAAAAVKAISEFQKLPGGIETAVNEIGTDGAAAMISALAQADFDGKLSAESQESYDAFMDGLSTLPEGTKQALSDAVEGAMQGMEGFDEVSGKAKEEGISFLEALRESLDEHSPSKKTEEIFRLAMEGAGNGVESGKEGVLSKAGEFITDFIGKFTEGGLGEKLQGVGADIMSFFGIGISSQNENSRAAGKANADAANEGAGSVNPTGNGALFGTLFGGGIGSTSEANRNAGNSIASSAEAGAGSVNPSGEGQTFGGQFAGGVGSKSGEAREKGSSLATNAKSGAGEADGYTPGSDFGAGFVRGIGAWLKDAASAAADLAISAYNSLRKALDERSPSRKTKKSGKNFDLGLSRGIEGNKKYAIKAAEELGNDTLEALDMSEVKEKMKGIDVSSVMDKVYMAFDDKKSRVADKMTSAVAVKENLAWKQRELSLSTKISDEDVEKIAVAFAKVASREMAKGMEGMGIYTNQREWGRLVREAVDR